MRNKLLKNKVVKKNEETIFKNGTNTKEITELSFEVNNDNISVLLAVLISKNGLSNIFANAREEK
jgi:hypothetical protein